MKIVPTEHRQVWGSVKMMPIGKKKDLENKKENTELRGEMVLITSIWRRKWQPNSSVLAWRIPGMEEPGGLPSMGSHRVGHD